MEIKTEDLPEGLSQDDIEALKEAERSDNALKLGNDSGRVEGLVNYDQIQNANQALGAHQEGHIIN